MSERERERKRKREREDCKRGMMHSAIEPFNIWLGSNSPCFISLSTHFSRIKIPAQTVRPDMGEKTIKFIFSFLCSILFNSNC